MLLSLTYADAGSSTTTSSQDPMIVGGKAASLAKLYSIDQLASYIPTSFALTIDFFKPWIEIIQKERGSNDDNDAEGSFRRIQELCQTIPLNAEQKIALDMLSKEMESFGSTATAGLAAVRSSAPEEDGNEMSFAGAFETKLGVTSSTLEKAVRDCFVSRFDPRVMSYILQGGGNDNNVSSKKSNDISYAVVVMEMLDSVKAGVCFSANPLNSDRDELVVDSSYGLGETVVDGSITADRYIYDKVGLKIIEKKIGTKTQQKKLQSNDGGGGVQTVDIQKAKQNESSLTDQEIADISKLVCIVENEYGIPMDVEWAYVEGDNATGKLQLKLLQARPITTLFTIDDKMLTQPGEKRILYYDYNVVADATTTSPFTLMDMDFYGWASSAMMGFDHDIFTTNPDMPIFKASRRQYCNMSIFLKYSSPEYFSKQTEILDPYLASIFASKDCDREKYRMKKLPKGVNLCNLWYLLRQFPLMKLYKIGKQAKKDSLKAKVRYQETVRQDLARFKELRDRGPRREQGFQDYAKELFQAMTPSFELELGLIFFVILPLFQELDKQRREGKTEKLRSEYEALCGGYEGDELMQMNIDIYRLANMLPEQVWQEYPHKDLDKLAKRIKESLDGEEDAMDLPREFLEEWKLFMDRHGWDGQDQLFPSSPRYVDSPVLLLAKLRQNFGVTSTNPTDIQRELVEKRREVMALHEQSARDKWWYQPFALSKIQSRNAILDHLMWIRNAPKIHLSQLCGILRASVLRVEEEFLQSGRLETKGDIFHINLDEVDRAAKEESFDMMELVRPRKAVYERALRVNLCPMLVDSRCRILKPDPPEQGNHEDGTLIGAAISPGVATGRVRIIHSPSEQFEKGEVLAAVVTGPAWTPLFVGAAAVVLQVGGLLQHGALCARELRKPAVSNIDIHSSLKTGMMVEVDGNTGTVRILKE